MFTAGVCLRPAYVYGRRMFTGGVCLRPAYVYGRRMFKAGVCLLPAYVYGRRMFTAGVCLLPAYVNYPLTITALPYPLLHALLSASLPSTPHLYPQSISVRREASQFQKTEPPASPSRDLDSAFPKSLLLHILESNMVE